MGLLAALALLALAGPAHGQAAWQARQVAGMAVDVYDPAGGPQLGQRPLLIVLHGCAQSAQAIRQRAGLERASAEANAVIAVPSVPNGGVLIGCWDYYGANHTRATRHVRPLLGMVDALLADDALDIAPEKVWIAGLSSGGGQAAIMGCVAPDVFAGVGVAAGPAVGTSSGEIGRVATDVAQATADCRRMAGGFAGAFDTQLFAVVAGRSDFTVAQDYARVQAGMAAALYGTGDASPEAIGGVPGVGVAGRYSVWSDDQGPRIARIEADGLGHAWPAGGGQGQELEFVAQQGPDFGWFLARFFNRNDRRGEDVIQVPQILWVSAEADPQAGTVRIAGQASDLAVSITVLLLADGEPLEQRMLMPEADGGFEVLLADLPRDTRLTPAAVARSADGLASEQVLGEPVILRDPAQDAPPSVQLVDAQTAAGCVEATGTSDDAEDGAPQVVLRGRLDGDLQEAQAAVMADGDWQARLCGLAAGCWEISALAQDAAGQMARSRPRVVGVGDGGAVEVAEADLNGHLMRYGTYGLGYGTPDITYVDLLGRYGLNEVFALYLGVDGRWYHDAANLPGAEPPECEPLPPAPDQGVEPDLGVADLGPDEGVAADAGVDQGPDLDQAPPLDGGAPDVAVDGGGAADFAPPALDQDPLAPDRQVPDSQAPDRGARADVGPLDQGTPRRDAGSPPVDGGGDVVIDCRQGPGAPTLWGLLALGGLLRRRRRS